MPISPHYAQQPGGPIVTSTGIPYGNLAATGMVDFTQFSLGSLQLTPGQLATRAWDQGSGISAAVRPGYTGAWCTLYNDSDSYLNITWTNTGIADICPPHHQRPIPIPVDEHSFTWSIQYQNLIQNPISAQMLTIFLIDQTFLASGAVLREGPINPPGAMAAGIGPGTLPPGVLVPAQNVFDGGILALPQYQLNDSTIGGAFWALQSIVGVITLGWSANGTIFTFTDLGGISVQNSVFATTFTLDGSGNLTEIAEIATTSFGVPIATNQAYLTHVTTTPAATILSFTPAATQPVYRISAHVDIANSGAATVTMSLTYQDVRNVARTVFFQTVVGGVVLNGAAIANGDYPLETLTLAGVDNTANMIVTYTDSTNTPNDRITVYVERLIK
jgi:hypothetical protein